LFGDEVSLLAIPLTAVLVLHATAAEMGYLLAAGLAPNILFSLHAGSWVDSRGGRRQLMIASDIGRALLLVTIPVAYVLGILTIAQLYVVAFLTGTLSVFFSVSNAALFQTLVPREQYVQGNSLLNGSRAVSFMAGPGLGGLLVQLISAPLTVLADALSFVVSALTLSRIRAIEPAGDSSKRGLGAGISFIRHSPILRASLGATATINFFNLMFAALYILYATRSLHVAPGLLGAVLGAGAVGSLIGSVLTGRVSRRIGVGPAFIVGCILMPAPLVLVPLAQGPRPLVLAMLFLAEFGSGCGVMLLDTAVNSIFAAVIPPELRARVSGAYRLVNFGIRPIGSVVGGLLGATIGLRGTLWIASVAAIAGFLWLLPSPIPRLRDLPAAPSPG
jgi:MFS family permease